MAIEVYYVYEPQYVARGWPDDASVAMVSWFDKDLADPTAIPTFFVEPEIFYPPLIQYQVFPPFFVNQSTFFPPHAFLVQEVSELLKNERRRVRTLRRKPPPEL